MLERTSALAAVYEPGLFGVDAEADAGVQLTELRGVEILQLAAWPDTIPALETWLRQFGELADCPGPGESTTWARGRLVRTEPLKWWALNPDQRVWTEAGTLAAGDGVWTDLSHSRTVIRAAGRNAVELLNRYLAVDLSDARFGNGAVATGLFDHLPATVIRQDLAEGPAYNVFVQRTYGEFFWSELVETAKQFGAVVREPQSVGPAKSG